MVVVAFPLGIATAVYLEEYAPASRLTRIVDVNIRNLAGVPSIVYGLLGLAVFVGCFKALGIGNGRNVIAGGLTVAVLVLPIVIITSAEALRAVPTAIREAGYGVGASRWQVTRAAGPAGRVPGHPDGHRAVALAGTRRDGAAHPRGRRARLLLQRRRRPGRPATGPYTALPIVVYRWTTLPQEEFRQLAAAGMIVLLVITFAANALAIYLRNRYSRSW